MKLFKNWFRTRNLGRNTELDDAHIRVHQTLVEMMNHPLREGETAAGRAQLVMDIQQFLVNTDTTTTMQVAPNQWAPAIWAGMEGRNLEIVNINLDTREVEVRFV